MQLQRHSLFSVLFVFAAMATALAQPANDNCENATPITNVLNWCSAAGQFSNVGATPSGYDPATCFGGTAGNDVWFSFVAQATDVTITIRGATAQGSGGTLQDPQVALYLGSCGGTVNQLECQSAPGNANVAEAYQGGLYVGATYLVRIQGAQNQVGTFQFCINNYNPPVEPTSDCPTSSLLCDKSPFVVQKVSGAGTNTKELDDADCFSNGAPVNNESNSTWFVWTCSESGSLEFKLTPLNAPDDLDFVVYRLPNGIGDCTNKEVIRCNAAGDNVFPSPCMGPTGLLAGDPDTSEDAGCTNAGDDAWISPFNMVEGETYALAINNFSESGNGFSIEFGGTGQFLGPEVDFTTIPLAICLGDTITVNDASQFNLPGGQITNWAWSFGFNSLPQVASGKGPHKVAFQNPGPNSVVLTIETNLGCRVTEIKQVNVFPDVEVDTVIAAPECNGGTNGVITINNILKGTPPYQFSWEGAPFSSNNSLGNLSVGTYNVIIRDANNCRTELDIPVDELKLTVAPDIQPPLCFGDENGIVTLNVTNGTSPYQFDWGDGNGFVNQNVMADFGSGIYTILGLDSKLCKGTFSVTVTDNPPVELAMEKVDISCFSANDGSASANPTGGVGNFTYLWSNGATTQQITGLGPGQYSVTVNDGNECSIVGEVTIVEPEDIAVRLLGVKDLLCNGVAEGEIYVEGIGGSQPFEFSADGTSFLPTDTLAGLLAGDYWVKIRDSRGCIDSVAATIVQPPALLVDATPADTTLQLGYELQIRTVTAPFARPVEFLWTPSAGLSCTDCPNPVVTGLQSSIYVVQITDSTGCVAYDSVRIRVDTKRPIYIPNAIAPEKNSPNDRFTLFGGPASISIDLLRVYDRWGELIFEKSNFPLNEPILGWDGKYKDQIVDGVFVYFARVKFIDDVILPYEGNVTVIR